MVTRCAPWPGCSVGYVTARSATSASLSTSWRPGAWMAARPVRARRGAGRGRDPRLRRLGGCRARVTRLERTGSAFNCPRPAILKAMLVIGAVLYCAQLIVNLIRHLQARGRRGGSAPASRRSSERPRAVGIETVTLLIVAALLLLMMTGMPLHRHAHGPDRHGPPLLRPARPVPGRLRRLRPARDLPLVAGRCSS